MKLDAPPIGVKVLKSLDDFKNIEVFRGASYCEAVKHADSGVEVLVTPGSIFCTGAIAWGANSHAHMASGIPFELFEKVSERLEYPGKRSAD